MREVKPVLLGKQFVVRLRYLGISKRGRVLALQHLVNVDKLFGHRVGDAADLLTGIPNTCLVGKLGKVLKRLEVAPIAEVDKVLLVEGIGHAVVLANI